MKFGHHIGDVTEMVSRPARGAWIEMHRPTATTRAGRVAPRKGRVD